MRSRHFAAGFLVLLGGMLLVNNMVPDSNIAAPFWNSVWTIFGLYLIYKATYRGLKWFRLALGLFLASIGIFNILAPLGLVLVTGNEIWSYGWPALLIAAGVAAIFAPRSFRVHLDWNDKSTWGEGIPTVGDFRYGTRGEWTLDEDLVLNHGIGDTKLDLTTATISPGLHRIRVSQGIGELTIKVPDDVSVRYSGSVSMGELVALGDKRAGLGIHLDKAHLVEGAEIELVIETRLNIGQTRIIRVPSSRPSYLA